VHLALQVVLGEHDWTSTTESTAEEERFNVREIIRHDRFAKAAQFDFDFALLKLDRPVRFGQFIR
jgi:hypothetical protein